MKNNITHLSQLKELHQRNLDHRGPDPSRRWELWGRIHQAENLLEDVGAGSAGTDQHSFVVRKRWAHQRMARTLAYLALTMVLLAGVTWFAREYVRPETSASFAGTAVVTSMAATLFAARSEDYHKIARLFETAHELESAETGTPIDVAFEAEEGFEWVWVCEAEEPASPPIFNAGLQVPMLTV